MVTPELARIIHEFENLLPDGKAEDDHLDDDLDFQHHESTESFQKRFHEKANQLFTCVKRYGNPFSLEDSRLLKLHTQDAVEPAVVESIQNLESTGQTQYETFKREALESGSKSIYDPISRNSLPLMSTPLKKVETSNGSKLKTIQINNSLFSQTVAVLQQRDVSLKKMFSHEFHFFAPSISQFGELNLPSNKFMRL